MGKNVNPNDKKNDLMQYACAIGEHIIKSAKFYAGISCKAIRETPFSVYMGGEKVFFF